MKTPPASYFIKKAAKLQSGAKEPGRQKVAEISRADVMRIAEMKMKDLNAADLEAAARMIEGSARSMGVTVVG
jgi:large subunit ribosomal protein L11